MKLQRLSFRTSDRLNKLQAGLSAGIFALLGGILILSSHAATPDLSIEAENATKTSPAIAVNDASASGGSALKFTSTSDPCALPNYPDETCTGVPAGVTLTPSGGVTIDTAGTVIDGRNFSGPITVNAPDVTIRNSRVSTNSSPAIDSNSTGLLIENVEVGGNGANGDCIEGSGFTARRVDLQNCENGFDIHAPGNLTVEDSYIHDLDTVGVDVHADGAQFSPGAANIIFRHNTIIPAPGNVWTTTGAINIYNDPGVQDHDITIINNRLIGSPGTVAIYCPRTSQSKPNIYIIGNRMKPGASGYTDTCIPGSTITDFSGNVDDSSGAAINPGD